MALEEQIATGGDIELSVSSFVALLNQTMEYAYPGVVITGELANLRVSKNRWVYFDLKDDQSSVKFFGTIYQLPGPLEDGMMLRVRGTPKLHNLYGFSVTVQSLQPAGEGTIKRAAALLQAKLQAEGLFDAGRKRQLPYPPRRIGLVASKQSAAYADFIKILGARWQGVDVDLIDVQVQGEPAVGQIVAAIEQFNGQAEPPDVLVVIRGGGSPEDLAAFSSEQVTRAVAASRIVTVVAIGHEVDTSLAELAADRRGSTPSNAAELLVPDRQQVLQGLRTDSGRLRQLVERSLLTAAQRHHLQRQALDQLLANQLDRASTKLSAQRQLLTALSPQAILQRGYALIRSGSADGPVIRQSSQLHRSDKITLQLSDGTVGAIIGDNP
ncbi:MAG: exodeoxyribonuclease VII large subunit [Candidatus Saccharimonadales bacterium]